MSYSRSESETTLSFVRINHIHHRIACDVVKPFVLDIELDASVGGDVLVLKGICFILFIVQHKFELLVFFRARSQQSYCFFSFA